jgi:hemoglobin
MVQVIVIHIIFRPEADLGLQSRLKPPMIFRMPRHRHAWIAGLLLAAAAPVPAAPPTLYERLGGREPITQLVSDFVDMLNRDPRLARSKLVAGAIKRSDPARTKAGMVEWLCVKTGGPGEYKGRDLAAVHAPLDLGSTEWKYMQETLAAALAKLRIPPPAQAELLALIETTRAQIVRGP